MISAEELRQFMYCKRVVYFRKVMGIDPPRDIRVKRGAMIHERFPRRESFTRFGDRERYHNIWAVNANLGLYALLDAMEFDGTELVPVEFKTGKDPRDAVFRRELENHGRFEPVFEHHVVQLAAQAILLEQAFKIPVTRGKIIYLDTRHVVKVAIDLQRRQQVLRLLEECRDMVASELIPEPTPHERKCIDCEFWNYCLRA